MTKLERYRGCLLAGGVGDQLGCDPEFMSRESMLYVYGPHGVRTMSKYITDDTQMTLFTAEGMLIGHLVQGVSELARCGRELNVRSELLMMLEHMILSHHDLPEYGSPKPPMFPEAEVLHTLDVLDARMFEMNRELANVQPGCFTERIWSLERKLYRRTED